MLWKLQRKRSRTLKTTDSSQAILAFANMVAPKLYHTILGRVKQKFFIESWLTIEKFHCTTMKIRVECETYKQGINEMLDLLLLLVIAVIIGGIAADLIEAYRKDDNDYV